MPRMKSKPKNIYIVTVIDCKIYGNKKIISYYYSV